MSLNKEKGFLVALGAGTVLVAGALAGVAYMASNRYEAAKEKFQNADTEVVQLSKGELSPSKENLNAKRKNLESYRTSVVSLQEKLLAFKPKELKKVSPAEFTKQIQEAGQEANARFGEIKATLPEGFALGFEAYTSAPVRETATPLLDYQLGAHRALFKMLADARPTKINNVYRERQPEEDGKPYPPVDPTAKGKQPEKKEAYRKLPMEVTFTGNERAVRDFLSAINGSKDYFYVVRSVRIANEKKVGPKKSEASFETTATGATDNPFGNAFAATPADAAAPAPAPAPADGATPVPAPPAPAPPPVAQDSSQILKQVLGNEHITCFVRLDVLLFNEGVELPKVPQP